MLTTECSNNLCLPCHRNMPRGVAVAGLHQDVTPAMKCCLELSLVHPFIALPQGQMP